MSYQYRFSPEKFSFIDNHKKRHAIAYLDYEYIRNEMCKLYRPNTDNNIMMDVVLVEDGKYTLKNVNLKNILYGSGDRVIVYNVIVDDTYYHKVQAVKMDKPQEMIRYEQLAKGIIKEGDVVQLGQENILEDVQEVVIPEHIIPHVEVTEEHELYHDVKSFIDSNLNTINVEVDVLTVLDAVVNHEWWCKILVGGENKLTSTKIMKIITAMEKNSAHIRDNIITPVQKILTDNIFAFPGKFKRLFGCKATVNSFDTNSTAALVNQLNSIINVDVSLYKGISTMFDNIMNDVDTMNRNIDIGRLATDYINTKKVAESDFYAENLNCQLIEKIRLKNAITTTQVMSIQQTFLLQLHTLEELQDVGVPAVISGLQACVGGIMDAGTLHIVNNIRSV